ncbi:MAG TPA: plastocyanin/azurin family copper-binding protein [Gaiellaceae bacterium]|nr:plastocyanin/azurin family copper-binding protein [Gaiellaceae bacterium]
MTGVRVLAVSLLAALALAVAGSALAARHAAPKLVASVSDPLNISLTRGGKKVKTLKAGAYTIVVRDKAADHNFHLEGPGVNKKTSIGGKGTFTWKVKLRKGTYTFVCDPHASFMKGSFKVK